MSGSAATVAYVMLAVFFGGVTLGVVAMVAVAVRLEDRLNSLAGAAPSPVARGARRLTGLGGSTSPFLPRNGGRQP